MPPARMRGDGRKAKNPKKTLLRLLSYLKQYIPTLLIVMLCIFTVAFASITGSTALGDLVDDFILPMVATGSADFAPLTRFVVKIGCIFAVGVVCSAGAILYGFVEKIEVGYGWFGVANIVCLAVMVWLVVLCMVAGDSEEDKYISDLEKEIREYNNRKHHHD